MSKTKVIKSFYNGKFETNSQTYLVSQLIGQAEICQGIFKKAHDKLDSQNSLDSIVNPAHGDDIVLDLICQIINELGKVVGDHDL